MNKIERYTPDINLGLTDEQIKNRIKDNLINYDTTVPTKSIKQIIFQNFFTLFNFLNLLLAFAVFCVGSYKNMLFLLIVIINTAISTIQEIHSKKIIDKLSILSASKVKAIRNGKKELISINEIVLDDIIEFSTGNQIPIDNIILDGEVQVDESCITGESNIIYKKIGDTIFSGSFIVSGKCISKVEHIGEENFTAKISSGAKYVKKINSEIMISLQKIIKFLTFAILPIGILLFFNHINLPDSNIQNSVVKTVAAIVGMIPEGLVLLTSTVLAVSVIRLSKSKVLVQELYCIETLARVDTLCLDKTGTLTEGKMEVKNVIPINLDEKEMINILANIAKSSVDENPTINAIRDKFNKISKEFIKKSQVNFSSSTKWSGTCFEDIGSYIIGAPEFVLKENFNIYKDEIEEYSKDYRVLVLAHSNNCFQGKALPNDIELCGYILLLDKIRDDAKTTLDFFKEQGVDIKIISGDNPITVSRIAKHVGIEDYNNYFDMSTLKNDDEIENVALKYTIFGRVSPMQKKLLVTTLQNKGKTVAMTGDGVNDVLALRASDCSIAMANGSDATKSVSQLILLDSNFASMPKVVAEGRRTINNIERSASLFLVKTIYSSFLALFFIFLGGFYPFEPIQLSLISLVCIGIPSFVLALEPNKERVRGNFLKNIISRALPTALTIIIDIVSLGILNKYNLIPSKYFSSLCVVSTGFCGIMLLLTLSKRRKSEKSFLPFSPFRLVLAILMALIFIIGLFLFGWWFNILPLFLVFPIIFKIIIISITNFVILNLLIRKVLKINIMDIKKGT